jgi:hypothetical protein
MVGSGSRHSLLGGATPAASGFQSIEQFNPLWQGAPGVAIGPERDNCGPATGARPGASKSGSFRFPEFRKAVEARFAVTLSSPASGRG